VRTLLAGEPIDLRPCAAVEPTTEVLAPSASPPPLARRSARAGDLEALLTVEWDFVGDAPGRYTHDFHPYPARFIADIPATVLDRVARPTSVVLDPFVGSGTTLVEATARGLQGVGLDVNPLATLIAKVKSTVSPIDTDAIDDVVRRASATAARYYAAGRFPGDYVERADVLAGPRFRGVEFWFSHDAQLELTALRTVIDQLDGDLRDQSLAALSAIAVRASRQDSDTRYVRREKRFAPLACMDWWQRRMWRLQQGLAEMSRPLQARPIVHAADSRRLGDLCLPRFDIAVTSSPYPNAFTYSLYHQLRAIWVDVQVEGLRANEIGNHRDYSRKNGSDRETFLSDMTAVLATMVANAAAGAGLVFVIGDSIVRGARIDNTDLLREAATAAGLTWVGDVRRNIRSDRKSFNPSIGKIRTESVCAMSAP
jgi:hypothetical protein